MEPIRLRLKFDDGSILSKSQKSDGLSQSWVLVEPRHSAISDVASHLLHTFDLRDSCPNGIILSMDGFVLPHFESTAILKDRDLVCVNRKGAGFLDFTRECGEEKAIVEPNVVEKLPLVSDVPMLANEEFEKETGGYQSETENDEGKLQNDLLQHHMPNVDASIKKRKASQQLKCSKRKRQHQNDDHSAHKGHAGSCLPNGDRQKKSSKRKQDQLHIPEDAGNNLGAVKCVNAVYSNLNENFEGTATPSVSRSTRRKKAKRQWLRSLGVAEREQLLKKQSLEDLNAEPVSNQDQNLYAENNPKEPDQDSETEEEIVPVVVRPGHIRFAASRKEKDFQQNQAKKESFNLHGIANKKKGKKRSKEKQSSSKWNEHKTTCKKQSASEWNDYRSSQEKQSACAWDKYKSAQERLPGSRQNVYGIRSRNWASQKAQAGAANAAIDYEKLVPMTDFPVQGDTIAYRLLDISSSFCPELTSYRVGKVSWFNQESNRVMLVPVPECPFEFKKAVDDTSEELSDATRYKEDGSLEIDFPSLADVRIVKRVDPNPGTALHWEANGPASRWNPTSGSGWRTRNPVDNKVSSSRAQHTSKKWTVMSMSVSDPAPLASGWGAATGSTWRTETPASSKDPPSQEQLTSNNWSGMNTSPAASASASSHENGNNDVWEEISAALSAKKAELLKEDNWNKKQKSANRSWSYRTTRK